MRDSKVHVHRYHHGIPDNSEHESCVWNLWCNSVQLADVSVGYGSWMGNPVTALQVL